MWLCWKKKTYTVMIMKHHEWQNRPVLPKTMAHNYLYSEFRSLQIDGSITNCTIRRKYEDSKPIQHIKNTILQK